ncbi:MAG: 4-hydroxy-tetrahydrodipicolinate synthase [Clostridia bacterium]|jgi:4-hydroxy-tetrahydrodipicolinate synthase|nr:4-hydroxy-tetrahydrodipicolinate synthase [Clostridia bacterium]MDN5323274.1 4-hydroxy-tetrahydrodipicolinate synthase [Clostridia bacterium]
MVFGRLLTAMVTPFNEKLEVDYKKAQELAQYLISRGNDGVVVAGTTGESPTLSKKEKVNLFKAIKEVIGNKGQVIAGTGSYSTKDSIELTEAAEEIGVDGVMLVVPYYNKPPQDALYEHFKTIAQSTKLPILLYNVPGRTSTNMLPETVARLSQITNIVAIKEAAGDMDQVSSLKNNVAENFMIFSGDDSLTLPMLALGAHGVISVAGHLVGNEIKEMIDSFINGNVLKAQQLHQRLFPLFKTMFITTNPIPVKTAVNLLGINVGGMRLPMIEATEEQKIKISQVLKEVGKL